MNDAHADLELYCREPTDETNDYGNPEMCDTEVTYEDHFKGMVRRDGWEGKALRLRCPECGKNHTICPVCEGGGWFRGEDTGKMLACHVCNQQEYAAQQQDPFF